MIIKVNYFLKYLLTGEFSFKAASVHVIKSNLLWTEDVLA